MPLLGADLAEHLGWLSFGQGSRPRLLGELAAAASNSRPRSSLIAGCLGAARGQRAGGLLPLTRVPPAPPATPPLAPEWFCGHASLRGPAPARTPSVGPWTAEGVKGRLSYQRIYAVLPPGSEGSELCTVTPTKTRSKGSLCLTHGM